MKIAQVAPLIESVPLVSMAALSGSFLTAPKSFRQSGRKRGRGNRGVN